MKRLIVVRGPMGAGKTTLCQVLLPYLQPAFWLDGDWCWKMEPFTADEAMREMVMENISFLLGQFLRAEGKDNVLFSWVLHEDAILEENGERIRLNKYPGLKVGSVQEANNNVGNWE